MLGQGRGRCAQPNTLFEIILLHDNYLLPQLEKKTIGEQSEVDKLNPM